MQAEGFERDSPNKIMRICLHAQRFQGLKVKTKHFFRCALKNQIKRVNVSDVKINRAWQWYVILKVKYGILKLVS